MIRLIALRDLTEFVRDGRLLWAGGLIFILLITAAAVGWERQALLQSEREAAQASDYDEWLAQKERHPHDAAHQGMHVFKPEPPLSIIDSGIGPYVGSTLWLRTHRQSETKFRPAQDATGLQRFGALSVAWVIQVLGPLLVVVLGFNAFSGEREQGTLRQVMSLGVPARTLLWGKALALLLALGLLLIPAGLIGALIVLVQTPAGERSGAIVRLLTLGGGYAVYLAATVFMVLAISAWTRHSRSALVALLTVWIVGIVLAPRAVSDLADRVYPTPSRTQFNTHLDDQLEEARGAVWKERFGVAGAYSPDLPLGQWGIALAENDKVSYPVLDRNFAQLWDTFERQQRLQEAGGLLFPLLAMRAFSMTVAGTDLTQHRHFSMAAEQHRRVIQNIMSQDLVDHADPLGDRHFSYEGNTSLWERVPPFKYAPPGAADALGKAWPSLAVLLIALVIAASAATLLVPRRPV